MPSAIKPSHREAKRIPFDATAMRDMPAWREGLTWPNTPVQMARHVRQCMADYLGLAGDHPERDTRRLLMVAGPFIVRRALQLLDYSRNLQDAEIAGIDLVSSHVEFEFFRIGGTAPTHPASHFITSNPVVPRHPLIRKLINIRRWTPPLKVPLALMFPTVTSFSGNSPLMHEYVGASHERLTHRDPGHFLIEARAMRQTEGSGNGHALKELADHITICLAKSGTLDGIYLDRFQETARPNVETILGGVQDDLMRLRHVELPTMVWTSSSLYQSRIVAHEIIRRGGSVVKFDHGGSTGMNGWPERDAFVDLNGATRLVMATNTAARITRKAGPEKFIAPVHDSEIVGGDGFPHIKQISRAKPPVSAPSRRRVMYCPTFSHAHSSNPTETMGEPIHTDFSLRIAEALAKLPSDFVVKPHPHSVPSNGKHYTEAVADVSYATFEDVMHDVDVFVFDTINSTTFWETLCTHKLVVLLHLGSGSISAEIRPLLERRCTVLEAVYDDRGRPQIDLTALEDAVLTGPHHADPVEFRQLLAHDGPENADQAAL
jgi:hypothetical protein